MPQCQGYLFEALLTFGTPVSLFMGKLQGSKRYRTSKLCARISFQTVGLSRSLFLIRALSWNPGSAPRPLLWIPSMDTALAQTKLGLDRAGLRGGTGQRRAMASIFQVVARPSGATWAGGVQVALAVALGVCSSPDGYPKLRTLNPQLSAPCIPETQTLKLPSFCPWPRSPL